MSTEAATEGIGALTSDRLRTTKPYRHLLLPRIVAGVPLLGIGLAHAFVAEAPMRPLVEAAGIPFAVVISPVAVVIEIVAGLSLLLGLWAPDQRLPGHLDNAGGHLRPPRHRGLAQRP